MFSKRFFLLYKYSEIFAIPAAIYNLFVKTFVSRSPFLNYKVAGGCVYGPQIGHWVRDAQAGKGSYEFPDHNNNCNIGKPGYDQNLWGPNSETGTDCVGPNNCLPLGGKLLAIGSGAVTIACCVAASFMIAGVRLRYKRQFHRL